MVTTNPLFKFGVDIEAVDADGKTALHRAAMFSDQDKVTWLLDEGLELDARDKDGVTPLHCAVFYMQRAVIKVLLSRGADISTKDEQGFTPLHTAASHSSFQSHLVTADLLEAGAPLEAVDDEGRTPLLVALDGNRKEAIDVLIAAGAQTDVADKKGRTALHLAVGCSSRMVEKLLALSVTIDAADVEGRTALHYAAQKGVKATAMVLLKAGADARAADKLGRRALDIAEEGAHVRLTEFLRQWQLPAPAAAPTTSLPPSQPGSPAAIAAPQAEEAGHEASPPAAPSSADMLSDLRTPGMERGSNMEPHTLQVERSISRAQKIQLDSLHRQLQEVDQVINERNSLQHHLSALSSAHELETSQLHQEKATLQASLRLAEDGQATMRARLLEAERRAGEAAQLRTDNADLARQLAAARADLAARDAEQPRIDALQHELTLLQARNAELESLLSEQRAEVARAAAAATTNEEAQAVRIRILQEANGALVGAAAAAPEDAPVAAAPAPLARAIQGAISSLQELPVLKERNRDTAAKAGGAKQGHAARQACGQGENAGPMRASPARPGVKRVGGGYVHTPSQPPKPCVETPGPTAATGISAEALEPDDSRPRAVLPPARLPIPEPAATAAEQELTASLAGLQIGSAQADRPRSADTAVEASLASETGTDAHEIVGQDGSSGGLTAAQLAAAATQGPSQRGTQHSYVPSAQRPGAAALKSELVLGSPSTRASTPQSRTQKWLKDNLQRSKGPGGSALKERGTPGSERKEPLWGSAKRKTPSMASKAHKSLIDRFNNPGNQ